ncbi:MAG: Carbamoyl-phosphate synthase large chain [Methanomicrobiales archaeon 53_19]|jgi:carbamoyl-phosphate synthase large subunit|uniref:carbamoyl-phosphate synthase large subunit n=2 Tax=Methanocalculus sp. TaxID=2004547 RepID=UPI00074741D6|nr:carbamoyl-phosphate synthase large subunit [Methanocalculus sp.]KUK69965.1 MAG: Carbamoyl-phosphate synthase large chain [Methanocalculus sp. 52_23]KUL03455.1 MAG: Carbamoyl-phosphate synthase large chain [Methanomicrobiales archaeon 53_19]HIJ07724.1 carbamoyl-phosphate synthase large subunit [Methanocalculus sp.]
MPKLSHIKKVLLIGSGPIQIGQAAEFDFSGTQACRALREEGISVVLVNSNPATIMTDPETADVVYVEPLKADIIAKIIEKEKPDGILSGLGGQTGLNITAELAELGALEGIEILGTPLNAIYMGEDREKFRDLMNRICEPIPKSMILTHLDQVDEALKTVGLPAIIRPAYTLGGSGGGVATTEEELRRIVEMGLSRSRIRQVLVEESVKGWNEIEFEVMRDAADTCIIICGMENVDPMGVHTGESVVVAPILTLRDDEYQMLRTASIKIIRALGVQGGCNVQYAFKDGDYRVIEVNPRVSRSSALASKATGYPIARVTAKIAIGMRLDEITNSVTGCTPASFEPAIDYVVVKVPRWPFDKFKTADRSLTTSMKSTGEVMAIGRTLEEGFKKALRSIDTDVTTHTNPDEIRMILQRPTDERFSALFDAFRIGLSMDEIHSLTSIEPFFLEKIRHIVQIEQSLSPKSTDIELQEVKKFGFSNTELAEYTGKSIHAIEAITKTPTYKMVDTCAAEFPAQTPYYYSTWESGCELTKNTEKKILILGSGPIRIGQGIEFDYCTVHAIQALRERGVEVHVVNNNPETVSTDFDTSDRLFFEPMQLEDVMNILRSDGYYGVMVQFGGQNSVNLTIPINEEIKRLGLSTQILGTSPDAMDIAEDRDRFSLLLEELGIPSPANGSAYSEEEAFSIANRIGYPVLVRPSYVLGGRAMELVHDDIELKTYIKEAVRVSKSHPVLIDRFLQDAVELDVDAVCDGTEVLIGGIMEHIEEAGVHSGDSACVIPTQSLPPETIAIVRDYTRKLALGLGVVGLINIQYAIQNDQVYVLEANPRASRTVPFVSKATGIPLAKIAARIMLGESISEIGYTERDIRHVAVKEVLLPFNKLPGVDAVLGPEMKSTGEVMGIDFDFGRAFFKASLAADNTLPLQGCIFISVNDDQKEVSIPIARKLQDLGLELYGTSGTVQHLAQAGIRMNLVRKVQEGSPNVIDMMRRGEIQLIINTPSDKTSRQDHYQIMRIAVDYGIPYITTIPAADAAAMAIDAYKKNETTIEPLGFYLR